MRIEPLTQPKPCLIFKSTGIKASLKKECDACPFSHSCPLDMLDDATAKILTTIGDYFYEHRGEYSKGKHHRSDLA